MKVLVLTRRFQPDIGGVEKHVFEISQELLKKGHSITVVTESKGKIDNYKGITIIRIPKIEENFLKKFKIWIWFWRNKNLIKYSDVVHAHDVFYWYLPFKLIFLSKKCFITFHGYESYPISKKAILVRKISEKMTNGNIIVGDFIKKWYHTNPDYIIYGGVNIPKSVKDPSDKHSAVFIGRLDYHTGILGYARSIDIIKKRIPKFKFTIVGDGEKRGNLKRHFPLGAKENPGKYLNLSNFAFVSRYLSILEALAYQRLVFALYDNPVKEDYLKMASFAKFIVIENSAEKLSERVFYYLKNQKKSRELTKEGYEWVKKQSWEKVAEIYLNLWKQK